MPRQMDVRADAAAGVADHMDQAQVVAVVWTMERERESE